MYGIRGLEVKEGSGIFKAALGDAPPL